MQNKRIFIGSSTEGLEIAESIQILLDNGKYEPIVWNQGLFGLGKGLLEELVAKLHECAFGIFIFRVDDLLISKDKTYNVTRDNVLLELGLSIGILGRTKTFIVYDNSSATKIMEDLKGVIYASFDGSKLDLNAALGPTVSRIKQEIEKQLLPEKILYTEWHLGTKKYVERLYLTENSSKKIVGNRIYEEYGGGTKIFEVQGYEGDGFYWLEYHSTDGTGGGTIMLHNQGTGNFDGLITAAHCATAVQRCYKNRWKIIKNKAETISYKTRWLVKLGEYRPE